MPGITTFRPRLSAVIGGIRFDDCRRFQMSHELNSIPTASLTVAVGADIRTGKRATIDTAVSQLKQLDKVVVELTIENIEQSDRAERLLFTGKRTIFEGIYVNAGRLRSAQAYGWTLNFAHWLTMLNYSSSLTSIGHPGNPFSFACPAVFKPPGDNPQAVGISKSGFIPSVVSTETGPTARLNDLWGNCFKPIFANLASSEPIDRGLLLGKANRSAAEALARMPVGSPAVPLKLDAQGADALAISRSLTAYLNAQTQQSWFHMTIWGKLVEMGSEFGFDIVPRVKDALVVPATVPLRAGLEYKTVTDRSGIQTEFAGIVKQVVRAVVLLSPATWLTMENGTAGVNQADVSGSAALFPENPENEGLVIARQTPGWLSNLTLERQGAQETSGAGGKPTGGSDEAEVGEDAEGPTKADNVAGFRTVAARLAQVFYAAEVLKHSVGEMACPLRFDIGVGSNLQIESPPDLGASDASPKNFFGRVIRVTTLIDADPAQCGTSFTLDQLRVKKDAEDSRYSVDRPALYAQAFRGLPLADDLLP